MCVLCPDAPDPSWAPPLSFHPGEKVMADDEFTQDLFRFLQLLCEGHNNGEEGGQGERTLRCGGFQKLPELISDPLPLPLPDPDPMMTSPAMLALSSLKSLYFPLLSEEAQCVRIRGSRSP